MKDFSENNNINIKLNNIFKARFGIDLFNNKYDLKINDNLLGGKCKLDARDLIYLLYDVEKEFEITISEDDVDNVKFNTIDNIRNIVNKELNKKMELLNGDYCSD